MEITMEMIEQVLDATRADYYTVKQALLEHNGDVEEAIKAIRDQETDQKEENENQDKDPEPTEELFSDEYADKMVDRLKERVKAGNVDKIRISREGKTILEVPVNVGMIGGLFGLMTVPWAMILGVIAAYGMNCKIEIIASDGESEDLL